MADVITDPILEDETSPVTAVEKPQVIEDRLLEETPPQAVTSHEMIDLNLLFTNAPSDVDSSYYTLQAYFNNDFVNAAKEYLKTGDIKWYDFLNTSVKAVEDGVKNIQEESHADPASIERLVKIKDQIVEAWRNVRNAANK